MTTTPPVLRMIARRRRLAASVLLLSAVVAGVALAQRASTTAVPTAIDAMEPPFASSLQIVPPGPQPEHDGMSYRMTLTWSTRSGAAAYRLFVWTDAVRAWYRTAQVTTTRADVHAFRSGCTAFIVVAVADPNSGGNTLAGVETTNLVRFPLSSRPELCPVKTE